MHSMQPGFLYQGYVQPCSGQDLIQGNTIALGLNRNFSDEFLELCFAVAFPELGFAATGWRAKHSQEQWFCHDSASTSQCISYAGPIPDTGFVFVAFTTF